MSVCLQQQRLTYVRDACEECLSTATFDAVVSLSNLRLRVLAQGDIQRSLAELARVLAPGLSLSLSLSLSLAELARVLAPGVCVCVCVRACRRTCPRARARSISSLSLHPLGVGVWGLGFTVSGFGLSATPDILCAVKGLGAGGWGLGFGAWGLRAGLDYLESEGMYARS